jgi:hypothetical protein
MSVKDLVRQIEADYEDLRQRFHFVPCRRVAVFLFADSVPEELAGRPVHGFATKPNVVVAVINPYLPEIVRHEMTHLFSAHWYSSANPLFTEGLAVWLQKTWGGFSVDECASAVLARRDIRLPALFKRAYFFDPDRTADCYILAGSFTGFLIRRIGWKQFRRYGFEASQNLGMGERAYRKMIKRSLNLTLEQAEARWRVELQLARRR